MSQPAPRTGMKRTGIVFVVLGVLLGGACLAGLINAIAKEAPEITRAPMATPVDQNIALDHSAYDVFVARTPPGSAIGPSDVTVTAPDGTAVLVTAPTLTNTLHMFGTTYDTVAHFSVPAAGTYRLQIHTETTRDVLLEKDLASFGLRIVGYGGGALLGGGMLVLGVVLLIVRAVKNRSTAMPYGYYPQAAAQALPQTMQQVPWTSQSQPASPPPGWYDDPAAPGSGRLRYWDGQHWQ